MWEVLLEIFACYQRQAADSPYGMIQAMFGDWADPVDMFGTSRVSDNTTRGDGRGVLVRLSCHVFCTLTATIEMFKAWELVGQSSRLPQSHRPSRLVAEYSHRNRAGHPHPTAT